MMQAVDRFVDASRYPSLQAAVDAVPEFGTLVVPPGDWKCGAARLKSSMTLRLEPGCRLIAPDMLAEYVPTPFKGREAALNCCFLGLFGVHDVTIEGAGELICQGHRFWTDYDGAPNTTERDPRTGFHRNRQTYLPLPHRPVPVQLLEARDVTIRGITIRDSASYTVWAVGCERLRLDRLRLDNIRRGPNTDGLDIDCCRDVWITDCLLECGDDCIALKSDIALLGRDQACERIHISGNTLCTQCCGIRIGYEGDGAIRDVVMDNTVIHHSNIGIDMLSLIPAGYRAGLRHGAKIENIVIRGVVMRDVRQAIKLWSNVEEPEKRGEYSGYIRNVLLADMTIDAVDASFIGGIAVSRVHLSHIEMDVRRFPEAYKGAVPVAITDVWGYGYLPEPLTIYQAPDTVLEHVVVRSRTGK